MSNYNIKALEKVESKTKIYLIIIALLLIILCATNILLIIPAGIFYAGVIVYTIWVYNKRKGELSSYINELTFSVDSAAKNTLINSPFPLIILETDGNVIWRSSSFNKEFANVGINAYIDELAKEIKLELQNGILKVDKEVNIDNKIYHVIGDFVKVRKKDRKKDTKYMITLYFIDNTEQIELMNKYNNAITCMGIIMIDNYEEIIQRLSEERKPQVLAEIEKKLHEWASSSGGVIIKKERDTYVVIPTIITETEKLQKIIKKLEVYYLANKSDNLYFALLADVSASDKQEEVFDEEIGRLGVELAQKLNAKYPDNTFPKFHFLYRKREWNDKEECYLGWERKRGMLTQFNAYILKRKENEFRVNTIDREKLPNIKYVITLDADTELVLNSGLELIGAMAHILNTPEIEKGIVAKRTWYFTATCRGYLRSG